MGLTTGTRTTFTTTTPVAPQIFTPSTTAADTCATIATPNPLAAAPRMSAPIAAATIRTTACRRFSVFVFFNDGNIVLALGDPFAHELLQLRDLCRRDDVDTLPTLVDIDLQVDGGVRRSRVVDGGCPPFVSLVRADESAPAVTVAVDVRVQVLQLLRPDHSFHLREAAVQVRGTRFLTSDGDQALHADLLERETNCVG